MVMTLFCATANYELQVFWSAALYVSSPAVTFHYFCAIQ